MPLDGDKAHLRIVFPAPNTKFNLNDTQKLSWVQWVKALRHETLSSDPSNHRRKARHCNNRHTNAGMDRHSTGVSGKHTEHGGARHTMASSDFQTHTCRLLHIPLHRCTTCMCSHLNHAQTAHIYHMYAHMHTNHAQKELMLSF